MRFSSRLFRFSTVLISSFSILPIGMPVMPEITSATVWPSTHDFTSGAFRFRMLGFNFLTQINDAGDEALFLIQLLVQFNMPLSRLFQMMGELAQPFRVVGAGRAFTFHRPGFRFELFNLPLAIFQRP